MKYLTIAFTMLMMGTANAQLTPTIPNSAYDAIRGAVQDAQPIVTPPLQDEITKALVQKLKEAPAPAQVTPHMTFDLNGMNSDQRALFVITLHVHRAICTTKQPDILINMAHAIMTKAPPDASDLARHLKDQQAEAGRGPGEWCRAVSGAFKTYVE
ncbi:hypothetical protein [Bradyrhizobium arachidis]|uniref:hypothetical protein n=1 Tax=Bradyrhizobium arachidis TaxID=858423 RepID=UPI0021618D60|nr:hypothetical protein [Bradyrhizobium arachidis]UVO32266.1 hypothetical protein KUF59_17355 [Bradyrhizobium arachidis]